MRTPRLFISGRIYEVCFRAEEGLPLVCTPYMRVILEGILAQSFSMYDCRLIAFVVMGNHIHLLIQIGDPEHLDDCIAYIKRESAHAVNNLLDRRRHTVWQESYDAVLVLDAEKLIDRLCYIFLNPARAGLVNSIADYPGLSSWHSLLRDGYQLRGQRIPRETIPALPKTPLGLQAQQDFAEELLLEALPERSIGIDPLSFLSVFPGAAPLDREEVRARIIRRVQEEEQKLNQARTVPVVGAHSLRLQCIRKPHEPKKFGKKMWVLGSTKEIRIPAINWFKEMFDIRIELKKKLSIQDYLNNILPGFFAPGGYMRANLNPQFVPI